MEKFTPTEGVPRENMYVEKIKELESEYVHTKLFPMGEISEVSYADSGKTLALRLSGDVPTNFESTEISIVHPDSEHKGWIGIGNIGITIAGSGVDIGRIPLPEKTVEVIKDIYRKYTGKEPRISFNSQQGSDATKFADPGLYNRIVEKK